MDNPVVCFTIFLYLLGSTKSEARVESYAQNAKTKGGCSERGIISHLFKFDFGD
jgi:hypothetical protein